MSSIVDKIHLTSRNEMITHAFYGCHKAVLLDFIGAKDYFIVDNGTVFNRYKFFRNKNGIVTKNYLPLVYLDRAFPYPWVKLETINGYQWFPVNQLLGWAFDPQIDKNKKYFLSSHPGLYPQELNQYKWETSLPEVKVPSRFKIFMDNLYKG